MRKKKITQMNKVISQLRQHKVVSRDWALSIRISRLGSIIYNLKAKGYLFEAKYTTNMDYIYIWVNANDFE